VLELPRVSRLTWLEAISHEVHGAAEAHTRHVLMTIALYMNANGETSRKYPPTQATLAKRTKLHKRSIIRHLALADRDGWLERQEFRLDYGQDWKQHLYRARVPDAFPQVQLRARGGDSVSPPSDEVVTQRAQGGDTACKKVVTQSHTLIPLKNPSKESLSGAAAPSDRILDPDYIGPRGPAAETMKRITARVRARAAGGAS
jgi:hypothetical protein